MSGVNDLVGLTVGGYTVGRHLKRGGMADVYLAHHAALKRDVALKVLLPEFSHDPTFVERFEREARAMARLEHPNVVQVYDTGTLSDGRPYFTMQYVAGGTLEERLESLQGAGQLMTIPYALAIGRQVASALNAAHEAGIVHRDMKSSNILLDDQGRPILTDLGIAFFQGDARLTRTDMILGTPHYISPEQIKGKSPDARSDIYSLGIVLYEMLAGQLPFGGESHLAVLHQQTDVVPPSLDHIRPGLSKGVARVVARCLEKDPDKRYQTADDLVAALDGALRAESSAPLLTASGEWITAPADQSGLTISRTGALRTIKPRRTSGSRTPLLIGGVAALALLVLGALWMIGRANASVGGLGPTAEPIIVIITQIVNGTPVEIRVTSTPAPIARGAVEEDSPPTVTATEKPSPTRTKRPTPEPTATLVRVNRPAVSAVDAPVALQPAGDCQSADKLLRIPDGAVVELSWLWNGSLPEGYSLQVWIGPVGAMGLHGRANPETNRTEGGTWRYPIAAPDYVRRDKLFYQWQVYLVGPNSTVAAESTPQCFAVGSQKNTDAQGAAATVGPEDADGDGVLDSQDQCALVPVGATPDPIRPGCPLETQPDLDGDAVEDSVDQCLTVPAGPRPDPNRLGCPLPDDLDEDGIADVADYCPETPQGTQPYPNYPGCPWSDLDGDDVGDREDICPTVDAGTNPNPTAPGCPAPASDADSDGWNDDIDTCPTESAWPNPDQSRPGCPAPPADSDGDGVNDLEDYCPDTPQGSDIDPARPGCPNPTPTPTRSGDSTIVTRTPQVEP